MGEHIEIEINRNVARPVEVTLTLEDGTELSGWQSDYGKIVFKVVEDDN